MVNVIDHLALVSLPIWVSLPTPAMRLVIQPITLVDSPVWMHHPTVPVGSVPIPRSHVDAPVWKQLHSEAGFLPP